MPLKERIDEDTLALLEVIEDPIWFAEFMRNTTDGETDKELHPKGDVFKFRWYQRDILTDKSRFLSICGGRAIGKCQPITANIYTDKGYRTIKELKDEPSFNVYALDPNGKIVLRRGKVYPDKKETTYALTTESGRVVEATKIHPFLTLEGWKKLQDIKVGDYVGVATSLPPLQGLNTFLWHELRWLGYYFLTPLFGAETHIKLRFRKQIAEMRLIARKFGVLLKVDEDTRTVRLKRKPGTFYLKNNASWLLHEIGAPSSKKNGIRTFPEKLKVLSNDVLQIFLESLFSQYAQLSLTDVTLTGLYKDIADTLQEILLRFGIESRVEKAGERYNLSLLDSRAIYRFYKQFNLPGVEVKNVPLPPNNTDTSEHLRFERVTSINVSAQATPTYAVYVYTDHNYISGNTYVHNSLVFEDKIIYEIVNGDREFPVTREQVLATANQAQLNPILDRIITRFTGGRFLKPFLQNQVNKSQGILKFPPYRFIFTARIAGSRGENNMVGLHVPRAKIDEAQLFPIAQYTQLMPAINDWEPVTQVMVTGVPNGLTNSTLYMADQKLGGYKRYKIASHNNPYYTRTKDIENIKRYGGENSNEYQQLVLGRHGAAAEQVLSPDSIKRQSYDFHSYRFNNQNKIKGEIYEQVLDRPKIPENLKEVVLVCDFGFVDSSIFQVIGRDGKGIWRTYVRYRLQRIDFPEQEKIVDWLDDVYQFHRLGFDIGAGGNGASIMQGLSTRDEYKDKKYAKRIFGFNNNEAIVIGRNDETGADVKKDAKSVAVDELVQKIENGELVFSELDAEGTNELERISKQRGMNGIDRYFILSDAGRGKSNSDHIFASYIVFALLTRETNKRGKKKLAKSFTA